MQLWHVSRPKYTGECGNNIGDNGQGPREQQWGRYVGRCAKWWYVVGRQPGSKGVWRARQSPAATTWPGVKCSWWWNFQPSGLANYYNYCNHFTALWTLSGTTWVSQCQMKQSPTLIYCGHQSSFICFLHLLRSIAFSLFNLYAWQSFSTISVQVFVDLRVGLVLSTTHSIHFFTQSLSSFHSTCP